MSGVTPERLGKYDVRGVLGRGAMGTVYDGWDPVIGRRVAIKTVRLAAVGDEEAAEQLARFKREAQAAGRLSHPNVVGVFDYIETEDLALIVMEFVEGRSLKELLGPEERMKLETTLRLMEGVLAGLAYSHGRGVVHRDIKPANIMVTADGTAKIADFGIARIEASSLTQAGTVMGTPAYMSPEQFMGQVVDARTDIYSCGVVLYQLLTGERPFEGSMSSIMHKALTTVPPSPSALSVTAPPALDAVVARAMARQPQDRFASAADFAHALRNPPEPAADTTIVSPPPAARPPVAPPAPAGPQPRQTRTLLWAGLGTAAVVAAAALLFALVRQPPASSSPSAAPPLAMPAPSAATPSPPDPALAAAPPPAASPPTALAPPSSITAASPPAPALAPSAPSTLAMSTPATPAPAPVEAPRAPPPPDPAAVATALASSLSGLGCTAAHATVSPAGGATITGIAGAGAPDAALHRAVAAASAAEASWQVRTVEDGFCPVIDFVRQTGAGGGGAPMTLAQEGGPVPLLDNQVIAMRASMPSFAGALQVTYIQHDLTVAPLVPGPGYPAKTYPARSTVMLGQKRGDFPGWTVGPPFGTDMILAVASTAPLSLKPLPDDAPLADYVAELTAAIDRLRHGGGMVAVAAAVLDTRPER